MASWSCSLRVRLLVRCSAIAYRHVGAGNRVTRILEPFIGVRALVAGDFTGILARGCPLSFWYGMASLGGYSHSRSHRFLLGCIIAETA